MKTIEGVTRQFEQTRAERSAAFPHVAAEGHRDYRAGLTKRDWFAGQALAGLTAYGGASDIEGCVRLSFNFADAMIRESDRGG